MTPLLVRFYLRVFINKIATSASPLPGLGRPQRQGALHQTPPRMPDPATPVAWAGSITGVGGDPNFPVVGTPRDVVLIPPQIILRMHFSAKSVRRG